MSGFFGTSGLGFRKVANSLYGPQSGTGATGGNSTVIGVGSAAANTVPAITVLGEGAMGASTNAGLAGSIAIGYGAIPLAVDLGFGQPNEANVIIGAGSAAKLKFGGGNTVVGDQAMAQTVGVLAVAEQHNTVIGARAAHTSAGDIREATIIGYLAANNAGGGAYATCVVIGSNAYGISPGTHNLQSSVVIGYQAGQQADGGVDSVFIGSNIALHEVNPQSAVHIGASQVAGTTGATGNVVIGAGTTYYGDHNVIIGYLALTAAPPHIGSYNVILGAQAGSGLPGGQGFAAVLEVNDTVDPVKRAFIADMFAFSIAFGDSTGARQDIFALSVGGGVGLVSIKNGTKSAVNPTQGGYFYVNAGALHWVGSGGTDTAIAPA